jgi:trans-aconitate methyltransferase
LARALAASLGTGDLSARAFLPTGDVLELACGPGAWTEKLLRHASGLTAVDGASEMLARARARVGDARVRFVQADLFTWTPDRRYDVVFFGFWLSHVPLSDDRRPVGQLRPVSRPAVLRGA